MPTMFLLWWKNIYVHWTSQEEIMRGSPASIFPVSYEIANFLYGLNLPFFLHFFMIISLAVPVFFCIGDVAVYVLLDCCMLLRHSAKLSCLILSLTKLTWRLSMTAGTQISLFKWKSSQFVLITYSYHPLYLKNLICLHGFNQLFSLVSFS